MSSGYESADLLALFNRKAGRPVADGVTTVDKYDRLAKAQDRVIAKMMAVAPNSLRPKVAYSLLPTLTTADDQIFTFGTDAAGYAVFPSGHGGVYASLNDIPDAPLQEGVDFISEGTQIRAMNNGTLPSTLYWYGLQQAPAISATVQPSLFPEGSRELIVIEAVRQFAQEYTRNPALEQAMADEWGEAWMTWCMVWKTQFRRGGALRVTGFQLAIAGQW